jgi:acetyl-CoA carboxylase carboxyltransferase component
MGGEQAAKTLLQIQVSALKSSGKEIGADEEARLLSEITNRYQLQTSPYYAAARLWVDGIIDPVTTREKISEGIRAANQSPLNDPMKLGVFQV